MKERDQKAETVIERFQWITAATSFTNPFPALELLAGGAVQAVSLAYLTHVSGETFAEYFRRGQTWGDGGMQAALIRQFDLTSRTDFLQQFAKQAVQKVSSRILHGSASKPTNRDRANVE
jgi:hypothetical protein